MTVEELRTRLRQGKIYKPEKVEQALTNFFRETNLSTLRELALRAVADEVGVKAASQRQREGTGAGAHSRTGDGLHELQRRRATRAAHRGSNRRPAGRPAVRGLRRDAPRSASHIKATDREALQRNIAFAEELGATVVRVRAHRPADGLIAFAQREGITHVIFGQSARSRFEILLKGSILNRFLEEVRDATIQVVPLGEPNT